MTFHNPAHRPVTSHDWGGFVLNLLEAGGLVLLALAAGFVGLYTVLYVLGAMGLL